jgi:hypothetical protein
VATAATAERDTPTKPGPAALPAGPRRPGALQSLEYGLDPYGYFRRAHRRFGDVFTVIYGGKPLGAPPASR